MTCLRPGDGTHCVAGDVGADRAPPVPCAPARWAPLAGSTMFDALQQAWDALVTAPHLIALLGVGWVLYLVMLGGWIVLQKREPVATLSWLLGLALLPYLGFLIYHVFGPQKIRRHRLRRSRSRAAMHKSALDAEDGEAAELVRQAQATTGLPVTSSAQVELLVDGAAKYEALLADIARAEHHVHLEYYIYEPDTIGQGLRDALVERARAGAVSYTHLTLPTILRV